MAELIVVLVLLYIGIGLFTGWFHYKILMKHYETNRPPKEVENMHDLFQIATPFQRFAGEMLFIIMFFGGFLLTWPKQYKTLYLFVKKIIFKKGLKNKVEE